MDRRIDQRFPANLSVRVTDLARRRHFTGTLDDISKSGLGIISESVCAADSIVKLEVADCFLFGHVVYCKGEAPAFRLRVELVRVLIGGTDLADLLNAVLVEALPATPGLAVSTR
jgi:hypothetical protein